MRLPIFVASAVFLGAAVVHGQEQERKLMDRILKPDMTLKNSAQDKQFTAAGNSAPTKSVRPKMFHFLQRGQAKEYAGVKNVETREFASHKSPDARREANLTTRNIVTENQQPYKTDRYSGVRNASDAEKSVPATEFAESRRPFLVQGKSQKALSAHDRPLTIDEVRELLNKNK